MEPTPRISADTIYIGVSSCLLGEEVRFNGGHKRSRYITDVLSEYFEYVPLCPELAIGLGVPRPPIRLVGKPEAPRAVGTDDPSRDVTADLDTYGRRIGASHTFLSGFILKAKSPSCGMERVKVYDRHGMPSNSGRGIFASALMASQPLLPVEEEGRLNDTGLRNSFLERVFVFHRWQLLTETGLKPKELVAFHTDNKFLLMAHDQESTRRLGRLVAEAGKLPMEELAQRYIEGVMETLRRPARRPGQVNVLQHISGFLSDHLEAGDRDELSDAIHAYRLGDVPILVPLTLIRHHLRRLPQDYLERQRFLERRPAPLDTRR